MIFINLNFHNKIDSINILNIEPYLYLFIEGMKKEEDLKQQNHKIQQPTISSVQCRKLKHTIDNNLIVFSLQSQNLLRICVYDQLKPSQVYQQIYFCDSLPNQAKNIFKTIPQMFQFLQMNFQALVKLNGKQLIIVDLNKLRIPIKFQLPLRLRIDPVVEDLIQSLLKKNQQTQREVLQWIQEKKNVQAYYTTQIQNLKEQINKHLKDKQELKQQILTLQQKLDSSQKQIQQLKRQLQNQKTQLFRLKQQRQQSQQQRNIQTEIKLNDQYHNKEQLEQQKGFDGQKYGKNKIQEPIIKEKQIIQKSNDFNIDDILKNYFGKQFIKQVINQQSQKKQTKKLSSNPFQSGLFSKKMMNSSDKKQLQPQKMNYPQLNISQIQYFQSHYVQKSIPQKSQIEQMAPQSRFHRFLQISRDGQIQLNLNNKFIKDSDIQQLIKHDWSKVKRINLSQNFITGNGLQTLLSKKWKQMRSLIISSNRITSLNIECINFKQNTPQLVILDLNFNSLSKQTFNKLIQFNRDNQFKFKLHFNGVRSSGVGSASTTKLDFFK